MTQIVKAVKPVKTHIQLFTEFAPFVGTISSKPPSRPVIKRMTHGATTATVSTDILSLTHLAGIAGTASSLLDWNSVTRLQTTSAVITARVVLTPELHSTASALSAVITSSLEARNVMADFLYSLFIAQ